jgi:hypothetical protein
MAKGVKGSTDPDNKPVRTSFVILPSTMKKIRFIALMEERDITSIVDEGLNVVIKRYEKAHGPVKLN